MSRQIMAVPRNVCIKYPVNKETMFFRGGSYLLDDRRYKRQQGAVYSMIIVSSCDFEGKFKRSDITFHIGITRKDRHK